MPGLSISLLALPSGIGCLAAAALENYIRHFNNYSPGAIALAFTFSVEQSAEADENGLTRCFCELE